MLAIRADACASKALACAYVTVNVPLSFSVNGLDLQAQHYKDLSEVLQCL